MKKKSSFIKFIRLFSLLTVLCISLTILGFELLINIKVYSERRKELIEVYYEEKKTLLEYEIERIITRLTFQRRLVQISMEKEVQSRCREAYQVIEAYYRNNSEFLAREAIKSNIIEILRSLSYRDGNGYYYAFDPDGTTVLNRANSNVEGQSTINVQDREGKFFIREMIQLAMEQREGKYTYLWFREGEEEEKDLAKTGYVMYFEPLELIIGTSVFEIDMKKDLERNLITSIEYVFADTPDYVFIRSQEGDILNGPDKGANVFDGNYPGRKDIFLKMLDKANQGGGYVEYPCPSREASSYIAYVTKEKEWDWIIGARITTKELDEGLAELEEQLSLFLRYEFIRIAILTLVLAFIVYVLFDRQSRSLLTDLSLFSRFFQEAALNNALIDRDKLHYQEFYELSEFANRMIRDKIVAEEERQKMRNLESLGYLAAGIAHDFNNCLMGIYGYIELAQMSSDKPEDTKNYLERSLETMERARSISDRLLTFTSMGKHHGEKISLNNLIQEKLKPYVKSDKILLEFNEKDMECRTGGEKKQISLILENILTNSIEALPDGKGSISVTLERVMIQDMFPCHLKGPYIRIDIEDNGRGIEKENLNKIFDPYYTTKQIGRGLGLSTVFSIIHQHKGHVEARRAPGGGTVISLYFPEAADTIKADSDDPV